MSTQDDNSNDRCACARHDDGSVTTSLCPIHADTDPCWTLARITGRRRKGTIRGGVCTSCGYDESRTAESRTAPPDGERVRFPTVYGDAVFVTVDRELGFYRHAETGRTIQVNSDATRWEAAS